MFAVKNIPGLCVNIRSSFGKKLSIVEMVPQVLYTSMDNLFDYCSYTRCFKAWMLILVLSLSIVCVIVLDVNTCFKPK